jgi:hypothetical protein
MFVLSMATALAVAAPVAGASEARPQPLAVSSSSLTQSAQQLTWAVQLTQPFAPAVLAPSGRCLCLLIERTRGASVAGRLCVAGPRAGRRSPQLTYQRVTRKGPGPAQAIAASVARAGSRSRAPA